MSFRDNRLKRSVLAACNIYFLKTINYIEVQKYLFGTNRLGLHNLTKYETLLLPADKTVEGYVERATMEAGTSLFESFRPSKARQLFCLHAALSVCLAVAQKYIFCEKISPLASNLTQPTPYSLPLIIFLC